MNKCNVAGLAPAVRLGGYAPERREGKKRATSNAQWVDSSESNEDWPNFWKSQFSDPPVALGVVVEDIAAR